MVGVEIISKHIRLRDDDRKILTIAEMYPFGIYSRGIVVLIEYHCEDLFFNHLYYGQQVALDVLVDVVGSNFKQTFVKQFAEPSELLRALNSICVSQLKKMHRRDHLVFRPVLETQSDGSHLNARIERFGRTIYQNLVETVFIIFKVVTDEELSVGDGELVHFHFHHL